MGIKYSAKRCNSNENNIIAEKSGEIENGKNNFKGNKMTKKLKIIIHIAFINSNTYDSACSILLGRCNIFSIFNLYFQTCYQRYLLKGMALEYRLFHDLWIYFEQWLHNLDVRNQRLISHELGALWGR